MLLHFLAKEGGIALLEVNPGLVIWTFISFGFVLFLLHRFAWGPISKALDIRASKIHNDIGQAKDIKEEAEKKLSEYIQKLDLLKKEGHKIIEEARQDTKREKDALLTEAKEEALSIIEEARKEVKLAKDQSIKEIHEQVMECAVAMASQILERDLKIEDYKKLALDSVKKIQNLN